MNSEKQDKITELIHQLTGTVNSMSAVCEELGLSDLDSDVTDEVDQNIFCCAECGWWCEQSEECSEFADLDEWTCRQCATENHGWDGEK